MNRENLLLFDHHSSPAETGRPRFNGDLTPPEPSTASLLLVDDRDDKLLAIEAILSSLGQKIVKAHSGKEALRHLLHQDFAVILMDVSMPCMDGFETAALIRKRANSEHTPIIFVTSINTSDNHVAKGYSLGAVDYILTPIVPEILRSKVSVLVELHKKSELVKHQAEQLRLLEESRHQRELADVSDRLEAETKRNRFFTLSLDLLAIASFDDYFIQLNPVWESTLGFSTDQLKSKSMLEFVHPEDRTGTAEQLTRLKLGVSPGYFENRYLCSDGTFRWLGWTAAPFASEQLVYVFARDITARKTTEAEIKTLNSELERRVTDLTDINNELEAFNYSISHDLRAPLRSIRSFAQFLREDSSTQLDAEREDYLRRVESAAKYMDILLLDLLQYSRLSRSELDLIPIELENAVNDVLTSIEPEVQERKAEIRVQGPLLSVIAHPATLRQILYNLISNALKFVPADRTPLVEISCEPAPMPTPPTSPTLSPVTRPTSPPSVRVWVIDHGIGIAPQYHKKIFGLFQRLHSQDAYPGTGIGLALVRRGLERMGGRIGLESEAGKGSRFWFELRAASDSQHPAQPSTLNHGIIASSQLPAS